MESTSASFECCICQAEYGAICGEIQFRISRTEKSINAYSDYFPMIELINMTSFNLIVECGFGWKLQQPGESQIGIDNQKLDILPFEFYELFEYCSEHLTVDLEEKFHRFNPFNWKMRSEGRQKSHKLRNFFREKILLKLKNKSTFENSSKNIFEYICELSNKGTDVERLIDEVMTFLIAGYETSATSVCFALMELSRRPQLNQEILDEIDRVVGRGNIVTREMIGKLEHLNAFIKEINRFYTLVLSTFRVNINCAQICEKAIPDNTSICIPFASYHRTLYSCGQKFIEDRFLYAENKNDKIFAFAYGPRNCIGRSFALMEMPILLVYLIQTFQFQSHCFVEKNINEDQEIEVVTKIVAQPRGGALMRFRPIERVNI